MNVVTAFLSKNWHRLPVGTYGSPKHFSCVIATPRFKASRHIIFFVMADDNANPILVAKVPRRSGDNSRLDLEAVNLRAAQGSRPGGFDSIPQVIAYEDFGQDKLLIETMIVGKPMSRAYARRRAESCIEMITEWLIDLQAATMTPSTDEAGWFVRLVEQPLQRIKATLPLTLNDEHLIDRSMKLTAPLRFRDVPLVFEHGDLSHPNVMLLQKGGPGVVDWELAEPRGLPATDFFFFLSYVAFARAGAESTSDYIEAFQKAFFGQSAWARSYIYNYVKQVPLPSDVLMPLFILTWARYVNGLITRLFDESKSTQRLDEENTEWLRSNRYYAMWRYTIDHIQELNLSQ